MAKARIGHFAEAQILEALDVDYIDESEVLTPADEENHIDKWAFTVPFVCGATNLGEALRRIGEGACLIRSKGEAGTGNVVEAVRHLRTINAQMRRLQSADANELFALAKDLQAPLPSSKRSPSPASCRCRSSAPVASPRRPTRRSCCNSAPRRSSSARASSRATTRCAWPRPSSRRRRTSATRTWSPRSRPDSAPR
jgi:hypothetical protein